MCCFVWASLVQVSSISVKAALYRISMWLLYLSLKGFPLAHCRGCSFQSMGGCRGEGWVMGVREVGRGRDRRFQRSDLEPRGVHGAPRVAPTAEATTAAKNCMFTMCHVLLHVHRQMYTCGCLHMAGRVYAYGHILRHVCMCVFSRCNAAGRIYMTS